MIEYGFRKPASEYRFEPTVRELAEQNCAYLRRNIAENGDFYATFEPFQNWIYRGHDVARSAHATWILAKAGRILNRPRRNRDRVSLLDRFIAKIQETSEGVWLEDENGQSSIAELSFLLLAITELHPDERNANHREIASRIAAALWAQIDVHGRIATHRDKDAGTDPYQDYFPGEALLALAAATRAEFTEIDEVRLKNTFLYYRHRFKHKRNFGQVSWLAQAGRLWWEITRDFAWAELVFEIADWIREFQLEKNGGFITRHQDDGPGYTSALYLEGLAAAASVAQDVHDRKRYIDFMSACENGFRFLRQVTIRPEDDAMLPNPDYAVGGLRRSFTASEVRLDFVQHSLAAALRSFSSLRKFRSEPEVHGDGHQSTPKSIKAGTRPAKPGD